MYELLNQCCINLPLYLIPHFPINHKQEIFHLGKQLSPKPKSCVLAEHHSTIPLLDVDWIIHSGCKPPKHINHELEGTVKPTELHNCLCQDKCTVKTTNRISYKMSETNQKSLSVTFSNSSHTCFFGSSIREASEFPGPAKVFAFNLTPPFAVCVHERFTAFSPQ